MTEYLCIQGGNRLSGAVQVSGAKNAALPLLIAALLTTEKCEFKNVPNIHDVHLLLQLLSQCGAEVTRGKKGLTELSIKTPQITSSETSYALVRALRASFWILAPLLARFGEAHLALPGGDIIGARPVDLHLEALTKMGAEFKVNQGIVHGVCANGFKGAEIDLRFASVGATHQILMAAALAKGKTVIKGAAREPEIVAVASMLRDLGCIVEGEGSNIIEITGREYLGSASVSVIGDRIEAGTYAMAAAATGGDVTIEGFDPSHLGSFIDSMNDMGLSISTTSKSITVKSNGRLKSIRLITEPFPGFATDLQAVSMAALTVATGESVIEEHIFEGRFGHVAELCRMGADIRVNEHTATIHGVEKLSGAPVEGHDIRAAAALVVAALGAEGESRIFEPQHLRRGYESLEEKLRKLGGKIQVQIADPEDHLFSGC